MNPAKTKSIDFITGYVYKSIEYNCAKNTKAFKDIPDDGYRYEVEFPKVWIGGEPRGPVTGVGFGLTMQAILNGIEDAFNSTFNRDVNNFKLQLSWGQANNPAYVAIQSYLVKDRPKKMTVTEIERALGYRVEIVSEG